MHDFPDFICCTYLPDDTNDVDIIFFDGTICYVYTYSYNVIFDKHPADAAKEITDKFGKEYTDELRRKSN